MRMKGCCPVIRMPGVRAVFLNAAAGPDLFRAPEIVFSLPVPAD